MSRKRFAEFNCSIARSLDEIGDWWTLLIVRDAFLGAATFSAFQSNLGIARNILADRLERLVAAEILTKVRVRPEVERYTYELTEKGRDLLPVVIAVLQWGDKWITGDEQAPVRILDAHTGEPIRRINIQSQKGTDLNLDELCFVPGPGADESTKKRL